MTSKIIESNNFSLLEIGVFEQISSEERWVCGRIKDRILLTLRNVFLTLVEKQSTRFK